MLGPRIPARLSFWPGGALPPRRNLPVRVPGAGIWLVGHPLHRQDSRRTPFTSWARASCSHRQWCGPGLQVRRQGRGLRAHQRVQSSDRSNRQTGLPAASPSRVRSGAQRGAALQEYRSSQLRPRHRRGARAAKAAGRPAKAAAEGEPVRRPLRAQAAPPTKEGVWPSWTSQA